MTIGSELPLFDIAVVRSWRPWQWAAVVVAMAIAAFLFALLAVHDGPWYASELDKRFDGAAMRVVAGEGTVEGNAVVMRSSGARKLAAVSITFASINASDIDSVVIDAEGPLPSNALAFSWLAPDGKTRIVDVASELRPLRPFRMTEVDGWKGKIAGVSVVWKGELRAPVKLNAVHLRAASLPLTARHIVADWFEFEPWVGASPNFLLGGAAEQKLPMPVFQAMWLLFIVLAAVAFRYGWNRSTSASMLLVACVAVWAVGDIRWQTNLTRQAFATQSVFGGKTWEEKRQAAPEDRAIYAFVTNAKERLPELKTRVFVYSDEEFDRLKIAYHLYPRNVLARAKEPGLVPGNFYQAGDVIVLFRKQGVRYARSEQRLLWDSQSVRAEMLHFDNGNGVFKVLGPG